MEQMQEWTRRAAGAPPGGLGGGTLAPARSGEGGVPQTADLGPSEFPRLRACPQPCTLVRKCPGSRGSPAHPARREKEPLLPARSSRWRFWPCPWCSRGAIWLSRCRPAPAAPTFREGLFAVRTRVWGSGMWNLGNSGTTPQLGSPAGLCRLLRGLGLLPSQLLAWSRRVPVSPLSPGGAENSSLPAPPPECHPWASACCQHTQNAASPADSVYRRPPLSSPHTHSPDFIFKEIITTAISNSFVWFP